MQPCAQYSGDCTLCPRRCHASRATAPGFCGAGVRIRVARAAPHHWEEPCISGSRGSGTVFFSHCPLGCVFCQNHTISHGGHGRDCSEQELARIFLQLQQSGVHNLNLVTATHYRPAVQQALALAREDGLALPVVWNTSGYETTHSIHALKDDVSVWLCDLKFFDPALSLQLCGAKDYFAVASQAVLHMAQLCGPPVFTKDGLLQRGLIIRLLVLPGHRKDSKALLSFLRDALPHGHYLLSVLSQYTPPAIAGLPKDLTRKLTTFEYQDVLDEAQRLGLNVTYAQERQSADARYTPPFDLSGLSFSD